MPDIIIRRAELGDAQALSQLGEATFRETFLEDFAIPYPAEDMAVFVPNAYGAQAFADMIADPAHAVWLAEVDGRPAGYAVAGPCGLPHTDALREHGELKRLYVARAHQGSGLGRRLFDLTLQWLAEREGPSWLGVWSGNLKAQRFYARAGFEKVGEYDFAVGLWRDHEFILRLA